MPRPWGVMTPQRPTLEFADGDGVPHWFIGHREVSALARLGAAEVESGGNIAHTPDEKGGDEQEKNANPSYECQGAARVGVASSSRLSKEFCSHKVLASFAIHDRTSPISLGCAKGHLGRSYGSHD